MTTLKHKRQSHEYVAVNGVEQDMPLNLEMQPSLLISGVGDSGTLEVKKALEGIGLRFPPVTNPAEDNVISAMHDGYVGLLLKKSGGVLSPESFRKSGEVW